MSAVRKPKELTPADQLREAIAWDLHLALRDGKDEVISGGCVGPVRDTAANAVYQASVGNAPEALFDKAVQAVAAAESFGVVGQRFAEFVRAASAHYVEVSVEHALNPDTATRVTFEKRVEVAA